MSNRADDSGRFSSPGESLSGSEFTNSPLLFFVDSFSFLLSFFFFFLGSSSDELLSGEEPYVSVDVGNFIFFFLTLSLILSFFSFFGLDLILRFSTSVSFPDSLSLSEDSDNSCFLSFAFLTFTLCFLSFSLYFPFHVCSSSLDSLSDCDCDHELDFDLLCIFVGFSFSSLLHLTFFFS